MAHSVHGGYFNSFLRVGVVDTDTKKRIRAVCTQQPELSTLVNRRSPITHGSHADKGSELAEGRRRRQWWW